MRSTTLFAHSRLLFGLLFGSSIAVVVAACANSGDGGGTCLADDVPDEANTDANCDGIDGVAAAAVFVSPSGNDLGAGTMDDPLRTLSFALVFATKNNKAQILMASGVYAESKTVSLVDGVGVFGGYEPKTKWSRGTNATIVNGAEVAMLARGMRLPTRLGRISVTAADATAPGASSIGLLAVDDDAFFVEDKSTIAAGKGAAGDPGKDGATGGDGGTGTKGNPGAVDNKAAPGTGGAPGVNVSCADAQGGVGGKGGADPNYTGGQGSPSNLAVKGGAGGSNPSCTGVDGIKGDVGLNDGDPGTDGKGGAAVGKFDAQTLAYVPAAGADGGDGMSGPGGGGGGGSSGQNGLLCVNGAGNGGGGGGAGGCGGGKGIGGGGGGASIAIVAIRCPIELTSIELSTFGGGAGGSGGTGGDGGVPGFGAPGGDTGISEIGRGGAGGDGRKGGRAGAGGGGGGGPSMGLWAEGAGPKQTKVTFKLGPAGNGGTSSGAGSAGVKGAEKEIGP